MLDVAFDRSLIDADAAYEVARRPNDVFFPIHFGKPGESFTKMRRRLAFQSAHHRSNAVRWRNHHHHMQMIPIKANRLNGHAGHTSQQLPKQLSQMLADARIQDPAAVLAYPNNVVLQLIYAMGRSDEFHCSSVTPPGSFTHGSTRGALSSTA